MGASWSSVFQTSGLVLFIVADSLQTYFPWYIRSSTSDCSTLFKYQLSGVSYGFDSSSYPNCHNYEGNNDTDCYRIYVLGFLMAITTFTNISLCSCALCSLICRGLMSSQLKLRHNRAVLVGLIILAISTITELIGFSLLFPYQRSQYCKYCTDKNHNVRNTACDYGLAHYISWIQLICIIISCWGFNYTSRLDDMPPYMMDWQKYLPAGWRVQSVDTASESLITNINATFTSTSINLDTTVVNDDYVLVGDKVEYKLFGVVSIQPKYRVFFSVGFCTFFSILALLMTFILINFLIPRDPTPADYCKYFFDRNLDTANCPIVHEEYFYSSVSSIFDNNVTANDDINMNEYHTRCPSMLCEETCCTHEALSHLPDFVQLFNTSSNSTTTACLESLTQVECLPCSPLSHQFTLKQYNLSLVENMANIVNSSFSWPVAICDSFCNTVYENCKTSQLSTFGVEKLKAGNCSDGSATCPTLLQLEPDYDDRICENMFQIEEVRHFAFTNECFDGADGLDLRIWALCVVSFWWLSS